MKLTKKEINRALKIAQGKTDLFYQNWDTDCIQDWLYSQDWENLNNQIGANDDIYKYCEKNCECPCDKKERKDDKWNQCNITCKTCLNNCEKCEKCRQHSELFEEIEDLSPESVSKGACGDCCGCCKDCKVDYAHFTFIGSESHWVEWREEEDCLYSILKEENLWIYENKNQVSEENKKKWKDKIRIMEE